MCGLFPVAPVVPGPWECSLLRGLSGTTLLTVSEPLPLLYSPYSQSLRGLIVLANGYLLSASSVSAPVSGWDTQEAMQSP
jgi:hypothetical protein